MSDASPPSVLNWLEAGGLAKYYPAFVEGGVTEENFVQLQFNDYDRLGVFGSDRQNLFKLIKLVREELESESSSAPAERVPSRRESKQDSRDRGSGNHSSTEDEFDYSQTPKIRVAVRKRPRNRKEKQRGESDIITVRAPLCVVHEPKQKVDLTKYTESHQFVFDEVFNKESTNPQIYAKTCKPLVKFFLDKGKAACFAYGQTGSGKTFTMMGPGGGNSTQDGLYVLAAKDIYRLIREPQYQGIEIWVSFFEIYGGKLFDLLNNRKKVVCREDGSKSIVIVGLREVAATNITELFDIIARGNGVRSTGQTGANMDSSRSHAILQIYAKKVVKRAAKAQTIGKFSFIDLAGSERAADTSNNDRRTRLEGAEINKSLLALKECIRSLDQGKAHQPFRGSKLTQVLRDSLIGNSKTIMIANVSPNSGSCEHTLNTLRYADRVKEMSKPEADKKGGVNAYMPHNQKAPIHRSEDSGNNRGRRRSSRRREEEDFGNSYEDDDVSDEPDLKEQDLIETHGDLCTNILREEESLLEAHRSQVDNTLRFVKEEMALLKRFDANSTKGEALDEYVENLDALLSRKLKIVMDLRSALSKFRAQLDEEKTLSSSFGRGGPPGGLR